MAAEREGNFLLGLPSKLSPDMAREKLLELFERYRKFVSSNPDITSQLESSFRVVSYFIAGRFQNSSELAELVYSASNLIVLLNDGILRKAAKLKTSMSLPQKRIMTLLTVLEYVEVFAEIGAARLWGELGRWIVIAAIQIAKVALRALLLFKHQAGIVRTPPITPLDREADLPDAFLKSCKDKRKSAESLEMEDLDQVFVQKAEEQGRVPQVTFMGTRSGRKVRSLTATPPLSLRDWKLPGFHRDSPAGRTKTVSSLEQQNLPPTRLGGARLVGEALHVFRPLVYLSSLATCGRASWKPWLLSFLTDVSSLALMGDTKDLNLLEKAELKRRSLMLLFYILRSPFYDKYAQAKIILFLRLLASTVPGVGLIIEPLIGYLPNWQRTYFYNWGT
ncbi:PREDICTED: peroxisomal membrane protein PEX16-like [Branchiostoma belcheri]|uniref:Peroxisomal membrane protein PEX16 n=1 Tax=Branchiostoma belcheri TaxID=7741 RepID=A0A6P4Z634_BRABE|nr:PREDICTED: peroxisomal membrane protein PEX16-like [Branchiostoma belcheri]